MLKRWIVRSYKKNGKQWGSQDTVVLNANSNSKRKVGRPWVKWFDDVQTEIKRVGKKLLGEGPR